MWKSHLDPYVTIHNSESSAFLPVIISIPNILTSIHVALYLPTAGKESEFLTELAGLKMNLDELTLKYPNSPIFIRGDANSSRSNPRRRRLFDSFCTDLNMSRVVIDHNTYHHFSGGGSSDSDLDVLLFSNQRGVQESLIKLRCQQHDPLVDSHHDLLLSCCTIPRHSEEKKDDLSENILDG